MSNSKMPGGLANMVPPMSEPDHYRYDPAQPTPSVGGAARSFATGPGSQDNRALEARPDVLTYTSAPFERDMEMIGPVSADLFVRSSLSHTDFFVRVTDVEPRAASMNVCDGLQRLFPSQPAQEGDGGLKVHIELFPTAYRFRRGHRLRVQVSSGAFPRFACNLGSGEPLSTATTLCMADQSVYHDPAHPSAIILPIVDEHQEVGTLLGYLVCSFLTMTMAKHNDAYFLSRSRAFGEISRARIYSFCTILLLGKE